MNTPHQNTTISPFTIFFSRFTTKLTAAILLSATIPAGIVVYFSISIALESQKTSAQEYYLSGAERVQERLLHRVESASGLILSTTSLLANHAIPEDAAIETVRSLLAYSEETNAIGIYDVNGNVVEILAKKPQHTLPRRLSAPLLERCRKSSANQNLIIAPPQSMGKDIESGIPLCAIWKQNNHSSTTATVIGYVVVILESEYLCAVAENMSARMFSGATQHVLMTDTTFRIIAEADREKVRKGVSIMGKGIFSGNITQNGKHQYVGTVQEFVAPTGVSMLGVGLFVPLLQMIIIVEEPQSSAYQNLAAMRRTTIIWLGICYAVAIVASIVLARHFSKPVKKLTETAQNLAQQNFSIILPVTRNDEFGLLFRTFNTVSQELGKFHRLNIANIIAERNKLETVVRQAHDGMLLMDSDGQIIIANTVFRTMFGQTNNLEKHLITDVITQDSVFSILPNMVKELAITAELTRSLEIRTIPNNEAKESVLRGTLAKILSQTPEQKPLAYLLVLRDVTREAEADKLKTELVSVVAHELRSPLNSIFGLAELIGEGIVGQAETTEYGQTIAKQSRKLADIINKFLDLSRLESGKIDITRIPLQLEHIARAAITSNAPLAAKKNMSVEIQASEQSGMVIGDPDLLGQVMVNLLSNAVKYSLPGKKIIIEICNERVGVRISIIDEGYGISDSSQERLFSKFFRASDDQRVKNESGTGLGLAFVKQIIEQHGGEVGVESRLHQGSTFWFRLPFFE